MAEPQADCCGFVQLVVTEAQCGRLPAVVDWLLIAANWYQVLADLRRNRCQEGEGIEQGDAAALAAKPVLN
jgi:hypothetical protein